MGGVYRIVGHKEVANGTALHFGFGEVRDIDVDRKYHVSRRVGDNVVGMGCDAVKELADYTHGVVNWGSLLRCEGSKGREHGAVNDAFTV